MTRAPGPAAREPGDDGGTRASTSPADAPTVVLPMVTSGSRPAPAVPEVPAIADIAAPGRPAVDAVVADEPPAPRGRADRRRPSRHMRARADEMAHLLARAAPSGRARRGLMSLPAAAAVLGAVAVGGVGIALGLDAQRAGQQLALPGAPTIPAEQTPVPDDPATVTTVDTGVVDALAPRAPAAEADEARPPAVAAAAPRAAAPPRATTPTTRPRPTSTTPRATTTRPTTTTPTPRSTTTPRPTPRADGDTSEGTAFDDQGLDDLDRGEAGTSPEPLDDGDTTAD